MPAGSLLVDDRVVPATEQPVADDPAAPHSGLVPRPDPQRSGGGSRGPGELARVRPGQTLDEGEGEQEEGHLVPEGLAEPPGEGVGGGGVDGTAVGGGNRRGRAGGEGAPGRGGRGVAGPGAATVHVRRGEHRTLPVNAVLLALAAHVVLSARR